MSKKIKVIVIKREDLIESCKNKEAKFITSDMINVNKYSSSDIEQANAITFIDNDGTDTILKSIYYNSNEIPNKQLKVYYVNLDKANPSFNPNKCNPSEFIKEAEKQGNVYTMEEFQRGFNGFGADINTDGGYIRFIEVGEDVKPEHEFPNDFEDCKKTEPTISEAMAGISLFPLTKIDTKYLFLNKKQLIKKYENL